MAASKCKLSPIYTLLSNLRSPRHVSKYLFVSHLAQNTHSTIHNHLAIVEIITKSSGKFSINFPQKTRPTVIGTWHQASLLFPFSCHNWAWTLGASHDNHFSSTAWSDLLKEGTARGGEKGWNIRVTRICCAQSAIGKSYYDPRIPLSLCGCVGVCVEAPHTYGTPGKQWNRRAQFLSHVKNTHTPLWLAPQ